MAKYLVSFTQEQWYNLEINADSEEDALAMFHSGFWEWDTAKCVGEETQEDSVSIEEW